ncbi:signal transduction histidine kinase [Microbacterium sp. SLBN-154]|uniref:sensor histidine kinase n=1 Tax=Microbacterium sp. SLBN-154 TaxID=2768458 RepID=UPI0011528758|nr:histidine kinase [Microbacterium sp. SLBN-154]TQK18017.1 signal transduction histidine kinase [Microbacterium sp. SLBN-154]
MPATTISWRKRISARRPAVDAIGYALGALLGAAVGFTGLWSSLSLLSDPVSPWWTLLAGLPAAALVLLRDRAPLLGLVLAGVLLVGDVLTVSGVVPVIVTLDLLYAAVVRATARIRRRILAVVLVFAAASALGAGLSTGEPRVAILMAMQTAGLLGVAYWWGTSTAQSQELVALHRQRAEDAERLAVRDRHEAVEREREAMARELHDLVAGHVSAVAIRAEAALSDPAQSDRDASALRAVRDSSLRAHDALRSMIAVLRTGDAPLVISAGTTTIPAMVRDAERSGLTVTLRDSITEPLPAAVDQAAARIVQEALANCVRHASGGEATVFLTADTREVDVRVVSRGGGPITAPELPGSGWGLELLRERVRALEGTLDAGPTTSGWSVRALLPREVPL